MDVRHYGWRIHTNNHRTAAFYVTSQCTSRMFSCWPSLYPPHRNNLRQARNRSVVRNRG
ncbi:hypothetical protein J4Q44_G00068460 [Coregonus suidteri]|uniref:Uncharacterized protein n=1 Tax=Coregonus suidteri TaxID=861788 RepID=A0AAN8R2H9_9TELE